MKSNEIYSANSKHNSNVHTLYKDRSNVPNANFWKKTQYNSKVLKIVPNLSSKKRS